MQLDIQTPRWALPLLEPKRYKLVAGGRGSGKSHERGEALIEAMIMKPSLRAVCIREIQKSLTHSAKALLEDKIQKFGVGHLFDVLKTEIRHKTGGGIIIFQGMQDHTAESIKSLEGFDIAWIEEAQSLSKRSLRLLRPTIMRKEGAEIWATWNPNQPEDAIEEFKRMVEAENSATIVHVNYDQNPFLNAAALEEIEADRRRYPEDFDHVYLGHYDTRSELRVFKHWRVEETAPRYEDVLYYGADWGFSQDPTVLLRCWIRDDLKEIHFDHQIAQVGVETDKLPEFFDLVPDSRRHVITADSARPETISYMNRHGFNVRPSEKGPGSVESGIEWLRGYDIVVHPRCQLLQKELRLYSYKTDKAGNILPKLQPGNDHCLDSARYSLEKLIKQNSGGGVIIL